MCKQLSSGHFMHIRYRLDFHAMQKLHIYAMRDIYSPDRFENALAVKIAHIVIQCATRNLLNCGGIH